MKEYFKHLLIRTPLEKPAMQLAPMFGLKKSYNHNPDLYEIQIEPSRIDRILEQILGKSSNCIDIGVHLGSMLSQITQLAPQGRHFAFEPIPYKVNWLKKKFPDV